MTVILSGHYESIPAERIEAALASGNGAVAKAEYHKLLQDDFFNVEHHIGYIRSHVRQHGREATLRTEVIRIS